MKFDLMDANAQSQTFLEAAFKVLEAERQVLTARELVDLATKRGLLSTSGKTPHKTMNARLSTDILHLRTRSRFMRTESGQFGLREWSEKIQEFIAPRRTIALFDEDILVFHKTHLRKFAPRDGLTTSEIDHHGLITSCFSMRRRFAEVDYDVIQLVSVFFIRHHGKILTHRRSKRLPEARLHYAYSAFLGGHLNPEDVMPLFRFSDPDQALFYIDRELHEELRLAQPPKSMSFRGLIYDPRTDVSTQHLGVVFDVDLVSDDFKVGERGFLTDLKLETVADAKSRIGDFENWSQLLIAEE